MRKRLIGICLMILLASVSYGQELNPTFETAYEAALIDSAFRYEKLKDAHGSLIRLRDLERSESRFLLSKAYFDYASKEKQWVAENKRLKASRRNTSIITFVFGVLGGALLISRL